MKLLLYSLHPMLVCHAGTANVFYQVHKEHVPVFTDYIMYKQNTCMCIPSRGNCKLFFHFAHFSNIQIGFLYHINPFKTF